MRFFPKLRRSRRRGRSKRRWKRRVLLWGFGVLLIPYALCALSLFCLRWMDPLVTAVHVQRRVESLFAAGDYTKRYTPVSLAEIPVELQRAVIAAEDGRFYQHNGIDWQELGKVIDEGRRRGEWRGGSTISQQLAKNLFLTTHRSVVRKFLEWTLLPLVELILPKNRILELYLNVIEWGPGVYGAEAAARYHYDVPVSRLVREQAARLAACIPAPRRRRPQQMNDYSREILARMERMGW